MGLQDTGLAETVRYRSRGKLLVGFFAFASFMLAFAIWLISFASDALVTGSADRHTPVAVFAIVIGVLFIAGISVVAFILAQPALVLTPDTLRIVTALSRRVRIPVSEITGVGLVFERSAVYPAGRTAPGWHLMVWHGDGRGEPVAIVYTPLLWSRRDRHGWEKFLAVMPAPSPGGSGGRFSLDEFDAATETDPAKLADTHAGWVARDVYQRVLARQGPGGPLAVTGQQKHVRADSRGANLRVMAFWSPDGVLGRPGA